MFTNSINAYLFIDGLKVSTFITKIYELMTKISKN